MNLRQRFWGWLFRKSGILSNREMPKGCGHARIIDMGTGYITCDVKGEIYKTDCNMCVQHTSVNLEEVRELWNAPRRTI